jgi:hypothetical protein
MALSASYICHTSVKAASIMETIMTKKTKLGMWLKRFGFWGFMFFLVKGLIWLIIAIVGIMKVSA